ncbi:MAG: argininosuccinate lyase, partial [Lysobacterales bacterium]
MSQPLWQKSGVEIDVRIMKFLAGDDVLLDREFFLHDITACQAHVEGLANIGVVSADESTSLK